MKTRVGHWKLDDCDVYIGRGSDWGNPYGTLEVSWRSKYDLIVVSDPIAAYELWIKGQPELLRKLPELRGKILGCFCIRLGQEGPCHGNVLARLADEI